VAQAAAQESVAVAQQVVQQDVEARPDGTVALRQGVAPARRISVEDPDMRHGRKSRTQRVDGYKRHLLHDLDSGLLRVVGLTAANAPEASATAALEADLARQPVTLSECHLDRAYLSSTLVQERSPELTIFCKAWPVHQGPHLSKTAFHLDWERGVIVCPQQVEVPFTPGGVVHFPAQICAVCPLRAPCTGSARGRSVTIHPDERLLEELRARQLTPPGRAALRERVHVEHSLAHIGAWQGDRARYRGQRKNLFDLRRTAVVHNLHVLQRLPDVGDLPHAA
jgi:transposase